jgi:hypothetical protein
MKTLLLLLLCSSAYAATTSGTLDYTGSTMSGTMTSVQNNALVTSDITGWLTAEIVVQNNILLSYDAAFHTGDTTLPMEQMGGAFVSTGSPGPYYSGPAAGITLTLDQGQVTGAMFAFDSHNYNGSNMFLGIGPDSFNYLWGHNGTCADHQSVIDGSFFGIETSICSATLTSQTSGTWAAKPIATPEIDPAGLMGALTFLGFGLAWVRGRRG